MTIIYSPYDVVNIRNELQSATLRAGILAIQDFIAGDQKPWSFYAGVALGQMAVATGIIGAAATLYAIGDTVDALLFKSPDGSDVRIFLNGIAHASIDTYAAASVWEAIQVTLIPGIANRIDFINYGNSADPEATGVLWFGLGSITVNGNNAYAIGVNRMPAILGLRLQDAEGGTGLTTYPLYLADNLLAATYQATSDAFAVLLNAVTGSAIVSASITLPLTLPGGIRTEAVANHFNERGANILLSTSGANNESVRIPAINTTLQPASAGIDLTETNMAALITWLTQDNTINAETVRAKTKWDYNFVAALSGKKTFHKR